MGDGEWEFLFNRDGVSNWDDEKVVEIGNGDGCATLKMVHFM